MSAVLSAALYVAEDASAEEASFDEAVELVPFELHAVSVTPARAAVSINDKIFFMSILRFCGFTACQCCILFIVYLSLFCTVSLRVLSLYILFILYTTSAHSSETEILSQQLYEKQ